MLCKKDQQQENRNIDDLPPLHDVEEPLNNDTGQYTYQYCTNSNDSNFRFLGKEIAFFLSIANSSVGLTLKQIRKNGLGFSK